MAKIAGLVGVNICVCEHPNHDPKKCGGIRKDGTSCGCGKSRRTPVTVKTFSWSKPLALRHQKLLRKYQEDSH